MTSSPLMGNAEGLSGAREEFNDENVAERREQSPIASDDAPAGVKEIEAISRIWTRSSLIAAYVGIFLLACVTSLEGQTTINILPYATSAFQQHSLIAVVYIVQGVVLAVGQPPMAAIANVFGRLEAFSISVLLYTLGYIQQATSNNVRAFASAQIFYSAGGTGLRILQQIFIADTSDLLNRALVSSLPDVPFLFTVWVGPPMAESLLSHSTWRWGFGIWAIILPVSFLPLALALSLNAAKARRLSQSPAPKQHRSLAQWATYLWYELDIMGLLLLAAAISLILIPCSLAETAKQGWRNGSIIAMLVVGCISAIAFPLWESNLKVAPKPFIAGRILADRTVFAGCIIAFFYFAVFYTSIYPYFFSYLRVVHSYSTTAAGHVTQTFSFSSTVSSIVVSLLIKYTRHYKYFVTAGASIYLLGIGIMIRYRVQGSSMAQIVGTQIAIGVGGGMVNVPAQLGVQASVTHGDVAAATVIFLTILEIGGTVGNAISAVVWRRNLPRKLALYLPPGAQGDAAKIFGDLETAANLYPVGSLERVAINRSYQETMNILLIIAACFCIPLLPMSLLMRNYRLDQMDQKVVGTVIGNSGYQDNGEVRPVLEGNGVKESTVKNRIRSWMGRKMKLSE